MPAPEVLDLHPRHLLPFSALLLGCNLLLCRGTAPLSYTQEPGHPRSQPQGQSQPRHRAQDVPRLHLPPPAAESSFVFSVPGLEECLGFKLSSYSLFHAQRISQNDRTLLTFSLQHWLTRCLCRRVSAAARLDASLHCRLSQLPDSPV